LGVLGKLDHVHKELWRRVPEEEPDLLQSSPQEWRTYLCGVLHSVKSLL